MALYQFECPKCRFAVERVQPFDVPPVKCPKCGIDTKRVIGAPAMIRVKGQGFPSRKKWMDRWTPESKPFSIGSLHGAHY